MEGQANNTINQNVYCKHCGMQNNVNSNFCSNCGNSLRELNYQNNQINDGFGNSNVEINSMSSLNNAQNSVSNNMQNNNQDLQFQKQNDSSDKFSDRIGILGVIGIILMLPCVFMGIGTFCLAIIILLVYIYKPNSRKIINIILKCFTILILSGAVSILILLGACAFMIGL